MSLIKVFFGIEGEEVVSTEPEDIDANKGNCHSNESETSTSISQRNKETFKETPVKSLIRSSVDLLILKVCVVPVTL